jgi:hypothetical protein
MQASGGGAVPIGIAVYIISGSTGCRRVVEELFVAGCIPHLI